MATLTDDYDDVYRLVSADQPKTDATKTLQIKHQLTCNNYSVRHVVHSNTNKYTNKLPAACLDSLP